jgi:hypothetical protein
MISYCRCLNETGITVVRASQFRHREWEILGMIGWDYRGGKVSKLVVHKLGKRITILAIE